MTIEQKFFLFFGDKIQIMDEKLKKLLDCKYLEVTDGFSEEVKKAYKTTFESITIRRLAGELLSSENIASMTQGNVRIEFEKGEIDKLLNYGADTLETIKKLTRRFQWQL